MKNVSALIAIAATVTGCSHLAHAPAGQSVLVAKAKRAEAVPDPVFTPAPSRNFAPADLEAANNGTAMEQVADKFTLANLCLQGGRYKEAINNYQAVLRIDPNFAEAWSNLAVAYQDTGEPKKAVEAFRKYKAITAR